MKDVPEEVVADILARLSVKDIVKCRSVCKPWYSLISSNFFQSYHLNRARTRNRSLILVRDAVHYTERTEHYSLYLDDDEDFPRTLLQELDSPFKSISPSSDTTIVGCCNGVVCFTGHTSGNSNDRAALWNPSIRKLVEIPPPIVTPELVESYWGPSIGFGYDAVNDDYKLVRVSLDAVKGQLIEIYSLRCGFWRMLDFELDSYVGGTSVHVDGVCYWFGSRQSLTDAHFIVSFALSDEVFDEIPLPDDLVGKPLYNLAGLCKGSLCVLWEDHVGRVNQQVTIWAMKGRAWRKLAFLETSYVVFSVLAFRRNDVVLFSAGAGIDNEEECLVRHDLKTGVEEELLFVDDNTCVFRLNTDYIESLVLL